MMTLRYQHLIDGFNAFAMQFITAGIGPATLCIAVCMYKWCKRNKPHYTPIFGALTISGAMVTGIMAVYLFYVI